MRRRAIIGLASIAALAGCAEHGISAAKDTAPQTTVPQAAPEVTLDTDMQTLIVDRVWEQKRAGICSSIDEVVATGMFSREEAIDLGMSYVDDNDVTPAQKAHLRQLVQRDC